MLFNPKTTNKIHIHHQKCTLFVFTVVCVDFSLVFSFLSSFRVREMSGYSNRRTTILKIFMQQSSKHVWRELKTSRIKNDWISYKCPSRLSISSYIIINWMTNWNGAQTFLIWKFRSNKMFQMSNVSVCFFVEWFSAFHFYVNI